MKYLWPRIILLTLFILLCVKLMSNDNPVSRPADKRSSELDIPLIKGNGTYKLGSPNGVNNAMSWSQYKQDLYIDKLLKQKRNGFFLEIGGYDGESFSNTLLLEKERGWTGLLVEANPYVYQIMVSKDRSCYMLNGCISNIVPNMTFILGGALTSATQITSKNHYNRIITDSARYKGASTMIHSKEKVNVKCYSLSAILKKLDRTHVDYFSLDVEGAELLILDSIDWQTIHIDLFTIETDQHRNEILQFMKSKGYTWIKKMIGDDIFIKK